MIQFSITTEGEMKASYNLPLQHGGSQNEVGYNWKPK